MKVSCPKCRKEYNIPDERIEKLGGHIVFSCQACKGKIEINQDKNEKPAKQDKKSEKLSGAALKKRILSKVDDLPPMPQVAQKGRQIIADENSSFKDLATVIETDQAIAARVLKIANSSYYGVSTNVRSVQQASVVLGMKTLHDLLTLACASSVLGAELKGYDMSSGDLWKHSLATAFCARSIASKKDPKLADDSFSAGLIHDAGKLILDPYIDERKEEFSKFLEGGGKSFLDAERNILGFDHSEIAADVCSKWQIPKTITTVIKYHHNPSQSQNREFTYIIHAADAIAMMSGLGAGMDGAMYTLDDEAVKRLELKNDYISMLMSEAVEYVENTTGSF